MLVISQLREFDGCNQACLVGGATLLLRMTKLPPPKLGGRNGAVFQYIIIALFPENQTLCGVHLVNFLGLMIRDFVDMVATIFTTTSVPDFNQIFQLVLQQI